MKKRWMLAVALIAAAVLTGCPKPDPVVDRVPDTPREKLLWSSAAEVPAWAMEEPGLKEGKIWFVGLSRRYSTEQGAREDARRDVQATVVKYLGTLVKNQVEAARISYGLDGDTIDPTASQKAYEKQLAVNMVTSVKTQSWYVERWEAPTGIGYNVRVLAHMPESAHQETAKAMAKDMARDAERKAKEANDQVAKAQAEKAADFWKQMQEQGLGDK
jgi:hypothetical protein